MRSSTTPVSSSGAIPSARSTSKGGVPDWRHPRLQLDELTGEDLLARDVDGQDRPAELEAGDEVIHHCADNLEVRRRPTGEDMNDHRRQGSA